MKKLILASAIAAIAANTATAATIYDDKGLTFKIKGDWQVQLRDNHSKTKDAEVEFDDLELKNTIAYDLGNGMKAFGQLDFGFKKAAEDSIDGSHLEEAYVGLAFDNISVAIGQQNYATERFGVESALENATKEHAFHAVSQSGDDVIRVDAKFENLTLIASTELEAEGEGSENGSSFDVLAQTELGGVKFAAAYQTYEATPTSDSEDSWGVSASTKLGAINLAADFSTTDTGSTDLDIYNVVAKFKANKTTTFTLGVTDQETSATTDKTQVYANVVYKFPAQKNVSVFAEVSNVDEDGKDYDLDLLAGLRLKF
ncbi:MAG: porin [Neptuniibacter sp.]